MQQQEKRMEQRVKVIYCDYHESLYGMIENKTIRKMHYQKMKMKLPPNN